MFDCSTRVSVVQGRAIELQYEAPIAATAAEDCSGQLNT